MAKRGRPRKNPIVDSPDSVSSKETTSTSTSTFLKRKEPLLENEVSPNRYDIEDEMESMEIDPYFEETAQFHRNADDAMGGIGLNFGDW